MKLHLLFRFPVAATCSKNLLRLLSATLLCLSPIALSAQSVTFAGARPSVGFGNVNLCAAGKTTPAPCSRTMTLTYNVTASGTLGAPKVVTQGAPNLDFTQASGSTCVGSVTAGSTCAVNVTFAPLYAGSRPGAVLLTGDTGKVLATTPIYGFGIGPQIGFAPALQTTLSGKFTSPWGLAVDGAGDVFVADEYNNRIVELPGGGGAQTTVGSGLHYPLGVAVDGAGDVFIADTFNNRLVEVPAGGGSQITLPFSGIDSPFGVAADVTGDVFAVDAGNNRVLELPTDDTAQITLPFTALFQPTGVAVDGVGDVFVANFLNGVGPLVELPAGGGAQITVASGIDQPYGVAVDGAGDPFITDSGNNRVLEFPAAGGTPTPVGSGLFEPSGLAVDPAGDVFISENYGLRVVMVQRSQPPALDFGTIASGGATTLPLTIINLGTGTLTVAPSIDGPGYKIAASTPKDCLAGIPAGQSCTLQIEFAPTAFGLLNGSLTLQTNATSSPTVSLRGVASGIAAPVLSLPSGVYATAKTVFVTEATPGAKIYYTTNGAAPTASSTPYTGAISINSTQTLAAIAIAADAPSPIAAATYTIATGTPNDVIDLDNGFADAAGFVTFNGSTRVDGSFLQLTDGSQFQAGSAFWATPVNIDQPFTTDFTFRLSSPNSSVPLSSIADGITFTIVSAEPYIVPAGAAALGGDGSALGYEGIVNNSGAGYKNFDLAIKFDLHNDAGEGPNSTGLYIDGAAPTVPAIDLTGTGIDLHSGHDIFAQITYDGANLALTLTDTATFATWSHSFVIDIPKTIGSVIAYVGFTGATGLDTANQEVLSWTYVAAPLGPAAPPASISPAPNYPAGFNAEGLTTNGSASLSGTSLQLTDGGQYEAGSAFYAAPLSIDQSFTTDFTIQLSSPSPSVPLSNIADGITFTILNAEPYIVGAGPYTLGDDGKALGYAGIANNSQGGYDNFSAAIKFDLRDNSGEGPDSTGLYVNGALPTTPAVNLTGTGIDLHSGHPFNASLAYDYPAKTLKLTITDTVTLATWSRSFGIDMPKTIGGVTAYIGFTGATGEATATQQIINWTFTNP